MITTNAPVPVDGLHDLGTESRMIATPWSRMVRGIGLGQHPTPYDPAVATRLRSTFEHLDTTLSGRHPYTSFARRLTELILHVTDPGRAATHPELDAAVAGIVAAIRTEPNPYHRLMAGCILMDSAAKLGLDPDVLCGPEVDVPAQTLAMIDEIAPDGIPDENQGRHGDYEKLSACSAAFLAIGQLGLADRLTSPRDRIGESLELLERVPAPFFRGRGGSMLFSVLSLLGQDARVYDGPVDHVARTLDCLDHAAELPRPAFPNPMTPGFSRTYPLVTMLNAIAMSGREEYLTRGRDRLSEIRGLMSSLDPVEQTHMGLYYIIALHNLGRLGTELPSLDAYVEGIVGQWPRIDPGDGFFLNGIAYPYMIQTALVTGRMDLVTDETVRRLVDSFPDLDRTEFDRTNRPYPVSYALNILGEIGAGELLFRPSVRYGGRAPVQWVIDRLSPAGYEEGSRLTMLSHALISAALRMRGPGRATPLFDSFRFPFSR